MDIQTAYEMVERGALVAGMRGDFPPPVALEIVRVCMEAGGINAFEFTMNSTDAIGALQAVKRQYGDRVCAGMGTVLNVEMARRVLDAGADMIIAPSFDPAVVELANRSNILAIPGVITPTEAVNAWSAGAKLLKIFPIGQLGLDYFKAVRAPLDHLKFMANGGINEQNVGAFLRAGAVACGVLNWLTGDGSTPLETIGQRARTLRAIVDGVRSGQPAQAAI